MPDKPTNCATCGAALRPAGFGRPPKYCPNCAKARTKEQKAQSRAAHRREPDDLTRALNREYMRVYVEEHREKIRAYQHARYLAHREEIAAKQRGGAPPREKRERTLEEVSAYNRQYYQAHREEIAAKRKAKKESKSDAQGREAGKENKEED